MGAYIADSFHLDPAPASDSESLAELLQQWERARQATRDAHDIYFECVARGEKAACLGDAFSKANKALEALEEQIGRAEAQSLPDVLAQVRLLRGLMYDRTAAPDNQDWQVDILTRISNGLARLGAQAEA